MTTPAQRRERRIKKATQSIIRAWVAILAVVVVALSIVGYQEARNRQLARANRAALRVIAADQRFFERFRIERAKDVNQTAVSLCRGQNASNAVLADIIRRFLALPRPPGETSSQHESRRILEQALPKLRPKNCRQLPTAPGANPPTKGTKP